MSNKKFDLIRKSLKIIRNISIKWNHSGKVRHIDFSGRCTLYREQHFNNASYLELVIEDKNFISNDRIFTVVGNYFALFELDNKYTYYKDTPISSGKPLSTAKKVFYTGGVVLGTLVCGEILIAGEISVLVVITFFYGANTVASCVYDLYVNAKGKFDKLDTVNIIRDYFWKKLIGAGVAKVFNSLSKNKKVNGNSLGNTLYCASEIWLGVAGICSTAKASISIKEGSLIKRYINTNIKGAFKDIVGVGTNPNYIRFGYNITQIIDGSYFICSYSESLISSDIIYSPSTNSSAISVVK
ncbi:MAG: hypothetical protein JW924_14555 [Fusobacteriaceae bacterium]|nr:hypothetical protein [Fusobacteriaceae bacterium]